MCNASLSGLGYNSIFDIPKGNPFRGDLAAEVRASKTPRGKSFRKQTRPQARRHHSARRLRQSARRSICMPHLAYGGLSENWLLKECGHRHWTLLATALGLQKPDFRDADGNRLYAAFTAVRVQNAQLGFIQEGDELRLLASLGRISRTQWLSNHIAVCADNTVARVVMISAFLRRTVKGSNRQVQRGTARAASLPSISPDMSGADLAESAHRLRAGNWHEHLGFRWSAKAELATFTFRPCPNNDFNGANFLYFASFQSIVDRAEWQWQLQSGTHPETKHRVGLKGCASCPRFNFAPYCRATRFCRLRPRLRGGAFRLSRGPRCKAPDANHVRHAQAGRIPACRQLPSRHLRHRLHGIVYGMEFDLPRSSSDRCTHR